ncbi:MAG TPA: GNAT family N-acetyltransferase [Lachnospiraceae bacterium]|uniref:GNAT family N-acetyltransferase n=1 Tax=Anaerosporobacter sp. TaxID=1872529 RepID=UPI000EDA0C3D|nr:GNAT family N-acetyltransferase [Anaerosporobacter sp.]HAB62461.1 GNAT family N-acetyltransferase [Lachnospiraceae bacterium]
MDFKDITFQDIPEISMMYKETFNSSPWNEQWTLETVEKRLRQMISYEGSFGLIGYQDKHMCGMILGYTEQSYDGIIFNINEFCVENCRRNQGIGTSIFLEFKRRLKEKGINEVVLTTSKTDKTEGFYQQKGLELYQDMVIMGKKL